MSLHRLDLPTLTVETAWKAYLDHKDTDKVIAVLALVQHFNRIDERARAKRCRAFFWRNELDHTAKGKVR